MHAVLLALVLSADPSPALKSLAGLNVPSLKPWLMEQLPSLGQCALPLVKEGTDEVSVQATFGTSPEDPTQVGLSIIRRSRLQMPPSDFMLRR